MREMVPLAGIKRMAPYRKPGYVEAYLSLGELDAKTGIVRISPENWLKIRERYKLDAPHRLKIQAPPPQTLGLGDLVSKVATPIASALGLDCIDPATKQLRPDSKCHHRKTKWNKLRLPRLF
jgi:hypothetical protein